MQISYDICFKLFFNYYDNLLANKYCMYGVLYYYSVNNEVKINVRLFAYPILLILTQQSTDPG